MEWYVAIVVLVFGVIFGAVSGFFVARADNSGVKRAKELDIELKQTRDELVAFKSQVTEHFSRTAELVNTLTENYRSIYSHLAEGAQRFSSNDAIKIETMNKTDPLLSSKTQETEETASGDKVEEGWYGEHPQETDSDETAHDDRFH